MGELVTALTALLDAMTNHPELREVREIVVEAKGEAAKPEPNKLKLRAILGGIKDGLQGVAALQPAWESVRDVMQKIIDLAKLSRRISPRARLELEMRVVGPLMTGAALCGLVPAIAGAADIEVLSIRCEPMYGTTIKVAGEFKNNSSIPLNYALVRTTTRSTRGGLVGSSFFPAEYNPVLPGQVTPFSGVLQSNPDAVRLVVGAVTANITSDKNTFTVAGAVETPCLVMGAVSAPEKKAEQVCPRTSTGSYSCPDGSVARVEGTNLIITPK
jgi:hypothetical protein